MRLVNLLSVLLHVYFFSFFFFNDTATTEIYTLSLHDALPISSATCCALRILEAATICIALVIWAVFLTDLMRRRMSRVRSEEHTSELQSRSDLVCRLLLEKKKIYKLIIRRMVVKPVSQNVGIS